jgi:hypothetical protein
MLRTGDASTALWRRPCVRASPVSPGRYPVAGAAGRYAAVAGAGRLPSGNGEMDRLAAELVSLLGRLDDLGVVGPAQDHHLPALPPASEARLQDHLGVGVRAAGHFWDAGAPDRRVYGVRALRELRAAVALLQEWSSGN